MPLCKARLGFASNRLLCDCVIVCVCVCCVNEGLRQRLLICTIRPTLQGTTSVAHSGAGMITLYGFRMRFGSNSFFICECVQGQRSKIPPCGAATPAASNTNTPA